MRLPWLQVDQDAFERAVELSAVLGIDEAQAMGHLVFLWRWSLSRPADAELSGLVQGQTAIAQVEAGARWRGERGAFVVALVELGLITEDGANVLRVKGLDRYRRELDKRAQDRERQALARSGQRPPAVQRTSDGQPLDVERQTQTQTQSEKKEQLPLSAQAAPEADPRPEKVFEHWRRVMGKRSTTAFDRKRRGAVEARLRDGYTVEELCQAVDGCALTPHNMGANDRNERFDDLELICRNAGQVDRFRAKASTAGPSKPGREDEPEYREVCQRARERGLDEYHLRQLGQLNWRREGEGLVGRASDPHFAVWCVENYLPLLQGEPITIEGARGVAA